MVTTPPKTFVLDTLPQAASVSVLYSMVGTQLKLRAGLELFKGPRAALNMGSEGCNQIYHYKNLQNSMKRVHLEF